MILALLRSRRVILVSVAMTLAAGACSGGGSGKPDDPCAVGPVEHRPIPIEAPGRRPPVVDASQFRTRWPIKHVIFIVKENRTFDNLFALFPGADGATTGRLNGKTIPLRQCIKQRLPSDLIHSYPVALEHWNKGKMDGFGNTGGLARQEAYSVARRSDVPNYWHLAENYVLSDNFFASAMGPSFPNHLMAIAASSGGTHDNPEGPRLPAFRKGWGCDSPKETFVLVEAPDGEITKVPPCFDMLTEGDLLNRANIPWAFYGAERLHLGYIWQAYNAIRHIRESDQWDKRVFNVEQVVNDIRDDRLPP
ncbi:MAG: alkaline phosphatase family protein, partial [Actinomycetota bacterium]